MRVIPSHRPLGYPTRTRHPTPGPGARTHIGVVGTTMGKRTSATGAGTHMPTGARGPCRV